MYFKQIYLDCLAQASYLVGDGGKAAIIDPRRDVELYLQEAERLGLSIEHVIATHVHADFVCGLRELAEVCGAQVYLGRVFDGEHECERLAEGDSIQIGELELSILETPGHTPESICIKIDDLGSEDTPLRLLTGDTMFVGDVGRPDLVVGQGLTAKHMAGMLFDSLQEKILPLDDSTEIYPAHGAGSPCGKNMSTETSSTLGMQRIQNWALGEENRERFVEQLTEGQGKPPAYFSLAAALNRRGPRLRSELPPLESLSLAEAEAAVREGAQSIDLRRAERYGAGHFPGSINIGLQGQFSTWAGSLADLERPIILIGEDHNDGEEAKLQLSRLGLENLAGFLNSSALGTGSQRQAQIDVRDLASGLEGYQVIDVRRPTEFESGHVPGAVSAPLNGLRDGEQAGAAGLDNSAPTAVICGIGYRSSMACRFLRDAGFEQLYNVAGGTQAWVATGLGLESEPAA
ncbi:MAG: rhodanese-like domain-containing protein [Planctomycetota bacterium]|jgi:glyoxylase-like metal-dependent hydrolase (beta-lactamase superfamily II)/rhodanese-related sulfurtransferase